MMKNPRCHMQSGIDFYNPKKEWRGQVRVERENVHKKKRKNE